MKIRTVFAQFVAVVILLATSGFGPEPISNTPVSADEFVRAMAGRRPSVIDSYFNHGLNPNARAAQDRPLLLAATLQQDAATVHRLLAANASADLADEHGLNSLMAAAMQGNMELIRALVGAVTDLHIKDRSGRSALDYAIAAKSSEAVELLLRLTPDLSARGGDILANALTTGDRQIVDLVLNRVPPLQEWTAKTRSALESALASGDKAQVKLLLSKHLVPPTPEGKSVPLLAYAVASHNASMISTLLECGADPNTVLPGKCDDDFLALLPNRLASYLDGDKDVTVLMLAAGVGEVDYLKMLMDAGADKNRATKKYKMIPLYLAAQTGKWQAAQVLLGSGPPPDHLRIEISLASQHVEVFKDGASIFATNCSTGRPGFATRAGEYVVTDKERSHRSTIYHVDMPYFMRLSCLDFGMHEGVVPNYPASHGCIRLPGDAARKLFAEIPVGTVVMVK